ncbi:MAG: hypothetical protein ACOYYJ_10300 [Chloroflexota bacterium]
MSQLALITLYGPKDNILESTISECQKIISAIPGIKYSPYDMRQIHATLVGLERLDSTEFNKYFSEYRNQKKTIDFNGLIKFLRESNEIKFQVQIGGFSQQNYPFTSMGKKPYERSFQIIKDKVVLIGWPISRKKKQNVAKEMDLDINVYPNTLDNIRHSLQNYNILHRYHANPTDIDNDFYFRIGILDRNSITDKNLEKVEDNIRAFLSSIKPIILSVEDIMIAQYKSEELPLDSTQTWSLSDKKLTQNFLWSLYS